MVIYLVGNKADLIERSINNRKVSKEEAIEYSKKNHFQGFCECSALKNINVEETFCSFYKSLYRRNKDNLKEKTKEKIVLLKKMQDKHMNHSCC